MNFELLKPTDIRPPFTAVSAEAKVRAAEIAWNTKEPERVALAYTIDSEWRNRSDFLAGRREIIDFLRRKWETELDYKLRKELWAYSTDRIAVRFEYEWHDAGANWYRSYGNEMWEFAGDGLMQKRFASINDLQISDSERRIF